MCAFAKSQQLSVLKLCDYRLVTMPANSHTQNKCELAHQVHGENDRQLECVIGSLVFDDGLVHLHVEELQGGVRAGLNVQHLSHDGLVRHLM
jgi:hypothetical protein